MIKLFDLIGEGRDKAKDDVLFNCSQEYEIDYVARCYGTNRMQVKNLLTTKCQSGAICNYTHAQVYALIKQELCLDPPVSTPRDPRSGSARSGSE